MRSFYNTAKTLFILCLGLILMLVSCKKEDNKNNDPALRLKSLTTINNFTMPVYSDSSSAYYHYNDENQLIAITSFGDIDTISISYNGTGRIERLVFVMNDSERDEYHAEWENRQMTLFNDTDHETKVVFHFNNDDLVEKKESYFLIDNQWVIHGYNDYLWENGNLVFFDRYSSGYYKSDMGRRTVESPLSFFSLEMNNDLMNGIWDKKLGMLPEKIYAAHIVFDDKNNPYYDFPFYKLIIFESESMFSKNNPEQIIMEYFNSSGIVTEVDSTSYTYQYNNFNFPVRRNEDIYSNFSRIVSFYYE